MHQLYFFHIYVQYGNIKNTELFITAVYFKHNFLIISQVQDVQRLDNNMYLDILFTSTNYSRHHEFIFLLKSTNYIILINIKINKSFLVLN